MVWIIKSSVFSFSRILKIFLGAFVCISAFFSFYNVFYTDKILPNIFIAGIYVGGLGSEEVYEKIAREIQRLTKNGLVVEVEGDSGILYPENLGFNVEVNKLLSDAFNIGRAGPWYYQLHDRIVALVTERVVELSFYIDENKLNSEIDILKNRFDVTKKDVRYSIKGTKVEILQDTKVGKVLDKKETGKRILSSLSNLDSSPITLSLEEDYPTTNPDFLDLYKESAEKVLGDELVLSYKTMRFVVSRELIGSWIISGYSNGRLAPTLDERAIAEYVIGLAEKIDTTPQNTALKVENGKVIEFTPPKHGRYLSQNETIKLIADALFLRVDTKEESNSLPLPVFSKRASGDEEASNLGIFELIGKATTPFTGSPKNRISNIKNGTKFLSGLLIPPQKEFSTVEALGRIDNTTGYLPELVIKGDETTPEFGGGLCQVSSTLFRAILNTGLPVIERRNHSYRVPYYEYDGDGKYIGPGLDATIYSPNPDFKFKNDTSSYILINGYVEDNRVTFELYGTSDGRRSEIDGPRTLSSTPPGDPVYIETDTLPEGEKKKIDSAHPGGVAVANYKIFYANGTIHEQEFKSYYRKWPEKYLVGIKKIAENGNTN